MSNPQVGPWTLVELLGRGSLGNTWRAVDGQGDSAAIKRIAMVGWAGILKELQRCGEIIAVHPHPGIVSIQAILNDGEGLAIVSDLVAGVSLDRQLRDQGAMGASAAVSLMADIAEALSGLHLLGLVHGDLKPTNILMSSQGVRLVDVGLAMVLARPDRWGPEVLGTIGYLDPAVLEDGMLRPSSDVYSMGICLYESLSGRRPFDGSSFEEVTRSERRGIFAPLAEVAHGVNPALASVVEACLSRHPGDRPSAAEVAKHLDLDGPSMAASEPQVPYVGPVRQRHYGILHPGGPRPFPARMSNKSEPGALSSQENPRPHERSPGPPSADRPSIDACSASPSLAGPSLASPSRADSSLASPSRADSGWIGQLFGWRSPNFSFGTKGYGRTPRPAVALTAFAIAVALGLGALVSQNWAGTRISMGAISSSNAKSFALGTSSKVGNVSRLPYATPQHFTWRDGIVTSALRPNGPLLGFKLGDRGDQVLLGRWTCHKIATAAVYRPSTGTLYYFGSWPAKGQPLNPYRTEKTGLRYGTPALVRSANCDSVKILPASSVQRPVR